MAKADIQLRGRSYSIACAPGQESRIEALSKQLDARVTQIAGAVGDIGDERLLLIRRWPCWTNWIQRAAQRPAAPPAKPGPPKPWSRQQAGLRLWRNAWKAAADPRDALRVANRLSRSMLSPSC